MKILGIAGSLKEGDDTEYLLDEVLKAASERGFLTESLYIAMSPILNTAQAAEGCYRDAGRPCSVDDGVSNFYDALERADGIIIATPALFGNVPAKLKAVFDRTMHLLKGLRLKDKAGCAISVSPYRNGGQERAIEVVQSWMLLQGMAVVGDGSTGAVVSPALEDRIGRQTVLENANKLCDLVERTRKSSCWGG